MGARLAILSGYLYRRAMSDRAAGPLTEARIRRILELHEDLRRRTRKDARSFLAVSRLPDIGRHETLIDVVAADMAKYFTGWNEDPAAYFRDRDRLLMIFQALKAGGIRASIERYRQMATGEPLRAGLDLMKQRGFGKPELAEAVFRQAAANAERQVQQLQTVSDQEERAVHSSASEIETALFRKRNTRSHRKP
jgi:hypothetical protein